MKLVSVVPKKKKPTERLLWLHSSAVMQATRLAAPTAPPHEGVKRYFLAFPPICPIKERPLVPCILPEYCFTYHQKAPCTEAQGVNLFFAILL
jgi:hypothetical protein